MEFFGELLGGVISFLVDFFGTLVSGIVGQAAGETVNDAFRREPGVAAPDSEPPVP